MREIRTSGRAEQNTHSVTLSSAPDKLPTIGLPALLQLVDWVSARRQETQSGGYPCTRIQSPLSPPAPNSGDLPVGPEPILAGTSHRESRTHSGCPQPDRSPARDQSSERSGGEA